MRKIGWYYGWWKFEDFRLDIVSNMLYSWAIDDFTMFTLD